MSSRKRYKIFLPSKNKDTIITNLDPFIINNINSQKSKQSLNGINMNNPYNFYKRNNINPESTYNNTPDTNNSSNNYLN